MGLWDTKLFRLEGGEESFGLDGIRNAHLMKNPKMGLKNSRRQTILKEVVGVLLPSQEDIYGWKDKNPMLRLRPEKTPHKNSARVRPEKAPHKNSSRLVFSISEGYACWFSRQGRRERNSEVTAHHFPHKF